ncbi:MAG TPA: prenyltransferase, partial [Actinomycetota bacterium]|nr:prenyltransferase [Actinomycetota bacterium]
FDPAVTGAAIASVQLPNGAIPHHPDGVIDPWNHVEAAMGLDVAGRHDDAARAYDWLVRNQRGDGSWYAGYRNDEVIERTLDANFVAYVAAGLWHHYVATGDIETLERTWASVDRAMTFLLQLQEASGAFLWARDEFYRPWPRPLLTSTSCIYLSLRCAVAIAETLGDERPDWELAAQSAFDSVNHRSERFEAKDRFAMDWYYPVLAGIVTGHAAKDRLAERWDEFVVEPWGVRCVSDRPWITTGETSEFLLALDVVGMKEEANAVFEWLHHLRGDDGGYWMGANFPTIDVWPKQKPTWASGSVLLAWDALERSSATSGFFRGETFPDPLEEVVDPL